MDDFKIKSKYQNDPNCEEIICKQQTLYNKYKSYISKDENMEPDENEDASNSKDSKDSKTLPPECPIGKDALGFYSWNYLHTMAAYYPELPTDTEKSMMRNFLQGFAYFYPCKICAKDFQNDVKKSKFISIKHILKILVRSNEIGK